MVSTNNLLLQTSSKNLFVHSEKMDTLLIRYIKHNSANLNWHAKLANTSIINIQSLTKQTAILL